MKLYIKYMVSIRCKMAVKAALEEVGLAHGPIDLGLVLLKSVPTETQMVQLKRLLLKYGLEVMDDKKSDLMEKLKALVFEMIAMEEERTTKRYSDLISDRLMHDYANLSHLFSEATGTTIEQFVITQKIEKAKELLLYEEFTLTEIAFKLNYSSVAHLSAQFKKVTGLTPTFFKNLKHKRKVPPNDM